MQADAGAVTDFTASLYLSLIHIYRVYGILKTKVDSVIMLYGNEVIHMKCKDLLKNLEYECVRGSVDAVSYTHLSHARIHPDIPSPY